MTSFQDRIEKLGQRVTATLDKLPDDPSPKYVHRLRTAVRRIESLASYSHPDLGRKQRKVLEQIAGLRKRAGKVRDLDVQIGLLNQIANGSTAADRHLIADALKMKRDKQAKRLVSATKKLAGSKFSSHIERIVQKAGADDGSSRLEKPLGEARNRLVGLEAEFVSHESHPPAELHKLRIQVKKLRYIAELGDDTPERQTFIEQLKAAQDALGAWHDWQELSRTAEKQFRQRINCPLQVEVRALLAARQITALAALRQLFSAPPELPQSKQPRSASARREMLRHAG